MCKMCGVVHRNLGKGTAARPRCIPQAVALFGIEPHPARETSAVSSVQEEAFLPLPKPTQTKRFAAGPRPGGDFALPWIP